MTLLEQALDQLDRILDEDVEFSAHQNRREEAERFLRITRRTLRAILYEERYYPS